MAVRLVPFDRTFLDRSWDWLQDPELKRLTLTPDFTREDQRRFFESLPTRSHYRIWGVLLGSGEPIGAAGLKNMLDGTAEYWGYIGERSCWGRGFGRQMLGSVEQESRAMNLRKLTLRVGAGNLRAVRLYQAAGYVATNPGADIVLMIKELVR
jgi:RimJ/RimL family protein N-acetyltransferase